MKADIPDKILIGRGDDGRIRHSYWTTDQELTPFDNTLFIRKDALLEWAKEQKKDEMANFPYILDMLIEKLESL